jgi:hypothetical protein
VSGLDPLGRLVPRPGSRQVRLALSAAGFRAPDNEVVAFGDSFTMRNGLVLYPSAFVGAVGDEATWTTAANSYRAPAESAARIVGNGASALNGAVVVVDHTSTTITLRYPYDVTGLVGGASPTIALHALRGDTGWFNYARGLFRMQGVSADMSLNLGVGGDTAALMLDRVAEVPRSARVAVLFGANDMGPVASGAKTHTAALSDARMLVEALLDNGNSLDLISPIPFVAGLSSVSVNENAAIAFLKSLRALLKGCEQRYPDAVIFSDAWAATKDSSTDYAAAGMIASDKIHPTPKCAAAIAAQYVTDTAGSWKKQSIYVSLSTSDGFEAGGPSLIKNPMLEGTAGVAGGGVSGFVPDFCSITRVGGTVSLARIDRDRGGQDLEITWVTTGATTMEFSQDLDASVVGLKLRAALEIETISGVDEAHYMLPMIEFSVGGVTRHLMLLRHQHTYGQGGRWPPAGTRYRFESDVAAIPADASNPKFRLVLANGAAGTHILKIACPDVIPA